jgi:hypothetical protein
VQCVAKFVDLSSVKILCLGKCFKFLIQEKYRLGGDDEVPEK